MESIIEIKNITVSTNKIECILNYSENLQSYFKDNNFFAIYSTDITNVPKSIAVIPLLAQLLPICWISNSTIFIDEIDKDFYESIEYFKKGYVDMYPMLRFKGHIEPKRIVDLSQPIDDNPKTACFFSGGVDAFATLFAHIEEKPDLITIWGADIRTWEVKEWEKVINQISEVAQTFNLKSFTIKSNFTEMLNYSALAPLIYGSGDNWWHGFQNGIGIISLAAPLAYINNYYKIYIASSYTAKDKVTCASHPTIDNNVRYSFCRISHDQYEFNRIQKLEHILKYMNSQNTYFPLRVCYQESRGENCCRCEKCLRTLVAILLIGDNPGKYGFKDFKKAIKRSKIKTLRKIDSLSAQFWEDLKVKALNDKSESCPKELNWIKTCDFPKEHKSLYIRGINFVSRKIRKYFKVSF